MIEDKKYDVAIDFDGVINSYVSGWIDYDQLPDPPVDGAIDFLKELLKKRFVTIISTRASKRDGKFAIRNYLLRYGMTEEEVNQIEITSEKVHATIYIDDRGYQFNGTFPSMEYLETFKPWYKR